MVMMMTAMMTIFLTTLTFKRKKQLKSWTHSIFCRIFNSLRTSMWKVKIRIAGMPQYVSTLISVQIFYDFALEVVLVFQWEVDQLGYFQAFTNR